MATRDKWANTEEEKIIFFDGWTAENLTEIANMRRNQQLTPVHELAIEPGMRKLLDKIANTNYSRQALDKMLQNYWYTRAYQVLQRYSEYRHPLQIDTPVNLLSSKGVRLFSQLKAHEKIPTDVLLSAAHKDDIDLDLFTDINFNPKDFVDQEYKFLSPVSGCPYQCVYCAEKSGTKIYSMPYPIYLKVLKYYAANDEKDAAHIGPHNNSEAPMYRDTIFNADLGDVSHTASKWQSKISILTKGVTLDGLMDLALSKRYYSRNKPSISKVNISLLEGDDIERNLNLAFNVQKIAKLYHSEHRLSAKIFASPDNFIKYANTIKKIKGAEGTLFWAGLEPIGRATNVKEAYIKLTNDEITSVMERAGFAPGEIETNMNEDFGHSRYLTADGHMQLDAFGCVYMKTETEESLNNNILYNIYNITQNKVR